LSKRIGENSTVKAIFALHIGSLDEGVSMKNCIN